MNLNHQKIIIGTLLMSLLFGCGAPTPAPIQTAVPQTATSQPTAPSTQLEKVRIAVPPASRFSHLPFMVAMALDLYKAEGLDVMLVPFANVDKELSLFRGAVDFIMDDPPAAAQTQGKDFRMVVSFARVPGYSLIARSDMKDKIKSVSDLSGQAITVPGPQSGSFANVLMLSLLLKAGLTQNDVTFTNWGHSHDVIADMMERQQVVVTLIEDPDAARLIKSGRAYKLVDLTTEADTFEWLGGESPIGLVTSAETIKDRPEMAQKMTNALVKALRYMASHSAAEIASNLPEDVTGKDKVLFIDTLQHSLPNFSKDGIVSQAGVKNAIRLNRATGTIKPDQEINESALYTNDFVKNVK